MSSVRFGTRSALRACVAAATCSTVATHSQAAPYELIYEGFFTTAEALNPASSASPIYFAGTNAFKINARFDDSSPNLAPAPPLPPPNPFDGFRAYAPSSMTLEAAGQVFSVSSADNPGLSVSIFDQNSFDPGFYGVGIIVDAVQDGAGIIGDFGSALPNFSVGALVPTEFKDYRGVGHSSGACISGIPPNCPHLVTPIVLRDASNTAWNLTLANYEMDPPDQPVNLARIVAVPEPASNLLIVAGLGMLGLAMRARRAPH